MSGQQPLYCNYMRLLVLINIGVAIFNLQVSESFSRYGPGVRFIEYTHGGQDNCNWAGHYGAKISCSSLVVCLTEKNKSSSSSSSSSDEES